MATLFKIARGSKASLDRYDKSNGTFYIITEDGSDSGDLYLDIGDGDAGRRVKLGGGAAAKSSSEWDNSEEISEKGTFYIVSDAYGKNIPGLKIGNGVNSIKDLPYVTATAAVKGPATEQTEFTINEGENLIFY